MSRLAWYPAPVRPVVRSLPTEVDTVVEDGVLHVRTDLPGVEAKDVEITFEKGVLTIVGVRRTSRAGATSESRSVRRLRLPEAIDAAGISARSENGVLDVSIPLPKRPEPRKIPVATTEAPTVESNAA